MFTGILVNGTRYHIRDYIASICLFFGLVVLYNANIAVKLEFEFMGIVLMVAALLADSVGSNLQEKILQSYHASPNELVCHNKLLHKKNHCKTNYGVYLYCNRFSLPT